MGQLVLFGAALVLWCAAHSLFAADTVKRRLSGPSARDEARYRLIYNVVSVATVLPLLAWGWTLPGEVVVHWSGPWRVLRSALWVIAAIFFVGGCRSYDMGEFAGLEAFDRHQNGEDDPNGSALKTGGILGQVRHPWYSGAFIILWSRDLDAPALLVSTVFTLYLVVGALLEERRLLGEFGIAYRRYKQRVPMFVPWKWPHHALSRLKRKKG